MCKKNIQVLKKMGSDESGHMSESRFSLVGKKRCALGLRPWGVCKTFGNGFFFNTDLLHV